MKVARIAVIGIAAGAGLLAAMLAFRLAGRPPEPAPTVVVQEAPKIETAQVLVARRDIPVGTTLNANDIGWIEWPKNDQTDNYITKAARPTAVEDLTGSITRTAFLNGEPMREAQLMKSDRGFMSVILAPGMRAIAIEVRVVSTAGGFVLPNDRVDVLLTKQLPKAMNSQLQGNLFSTETLLSNIKVLAVDQQVSDQKGEASVVVRNTVTLEATPRQAEQLALAQQVGTLQLTLRPIRDAQVDSGPEESQDVSAPVRVIRFGQPSTSLTH